MAIIVSSKGGGTTDYTPIPAGNYVARCYSMIDLGTHEEEILGQKKWIRKIRLSFELPTELKTFEEGKGEQPMSISREFTPSLHEKSSLRMFLKSWRGKDFTEEEVKAFDLTKLLGVPCLLNIIHKQGKKDPTKVYSDIASATPLIKGMTCPTQMNPSFEFSLDEFDETTFSAIYTKLKEKIELSQEYLALKAKPVAKAPVAVNEDDFSDLPF